MRNPILVLINIRALIRFGIVFCSLLGVLSVSAQAAIYGFAEFDPGLYRGSKPDSREDFELLKSEGIKTILSLQTSEDSKIFEKEQTTLNQMTYINIPFSYILPSKAKMVEILGFLQDDSLKPLYMHCYRGQDRTGLAIGMYRIHIQSRDAETAYNEMVRFNFHSNVQLALRMFFEFYKNPGSLMPSNR
jgi:protein tyrosine/serine phosphatase